MRIRNHNADACKDDSIMTQANEQLAREKLQGQKNTLATRLASRRVVSLGISPAMSNIGCQQMVSENCIRTGTCRSL
jgi:hypothetical protein